MGIKFSFWSYGILAIAALGMFLYTTTSISGRPDIGSPLLSMTNFIVVAFIFYMFAKLLIRRL